MVTNNEMIPTLSRMYRETLGSWGMCIFLIGAFNVLYSTVFVATASNARLFADAAALFGALKYETPEQRVRTVRWVCVGLPALEFFLWLADWAMEAAGVHQVTEQLGGLLK